MFRRLAREAVIFMLLGMAVAGVSNFIYRHQRQAVFALLHDSAFLSRPLEERRAILSHTDPDFAALTPEDQQSVLEWSIKARTQMPKNNFELASAALVFSLYGLAGGFGAWLFYRLIRFAIKG